MDVPDESRPASPAKLSKTPSWITLGFVLGAAFVLALPRHDPPPPVQITLTPAAPVAVAPKPVETPSFTTVEAVFADWGRGAVWDRDVTEVALWDSAKRSYSDYYEVVRFGENYYFRSITRLTRPLLTRGAKPDAPLQFTETAEQRQDWLRESSRALNDAARASRLPPAGPATAADGPH
jgi:fermentation-respiration switch protein FrsA (DUF1100 family)